MPLGTHRERSSIPSGKGERDSGGDEIRWVYPSEQQFFNALLRKGWQPDERDVPAVVHIHNQVNERCWTNIRSWESRAGEDYPRLEKFAGRGSVFSPKARVQNAIGYTLPFDRHDWTVRRQDGTTRRYVLDFYRGRGGEESMYLDIRPALDSPGAVYERIKGNASSLARPKLTVHQGERKERQGA